MRTIGISTAYPTPAHRSQLDALACELGFTTVYCPGDELYQNIADYEIIYGHPDPTRLQEAKNLKWLHCDYAGIDPYLSDSVWPHPDCILSNSSGAYGITISEHIVMVLLMQMRRMTQYQRNMAQKLWTPDIGAMRSIMGSHIVVLGTGDIGTNAARRLKALGATITGVCRSGRADDPCYDKVLPIDSLDEVLPLADALVMSLPSTPSTRGLMTAERIALLPSHALIVNVGRGTVFDQQALTLALQENRIAGAALDVLMQEPLPDADPLWDCENALLTPHCSGNLTLGLTCDINLKLFCDDLRRYAVGQPLQQQIDRTIGY